MRLAERHLKATIDVIEGKWKRSCAPEAESVVMRETPPFREASLMTNSLRTDDNCQRVFGLS
jgi:hypothetical protein